MSCHSRDVGWWEEEMTGRWATNDSHKMKINSNSATNDIIDPIDEITFHLVNASG